MASGDDITTADRSFTIVRTFDAPRALVYRAWTDPEQLGRWFPPEGFGAAHCAVEPRVGGAFRVDMRAPDGPPFEGAVFPGPGVIRELVPNERLVFTMQPELGEQRLPMVRTTVTFEDVAGGTRVTVQEELATSGEFERMVRQGMVEGMVQSLGKLAGVLSGDPTDRGVRVDGGTLTLVRVFAEPRSRVWAAYTDPAEVTGWLHADGWETPFAEIELRTGGAFRIGMRPADGSGEGFVLDGAYREVVPEERLVQVLGDGRVLATTLEDVLGGTRLTLSIEMALDEARERTGYTQILRRFAAHLAGAATR
jgi:uncharacterized protein YndB with AHSA1/START domain